jgi:hypothetical protein
MDTNNMTIYVSGLPWDELCNIFEASDQGHWLYNPLFLLDLGLGYVADTVDQELEIFFWLKNVGIVFQVE